MEKFKCPHCGQELDSQQILSHGAKLMVARSNERLTIEQRRERASKASKVRWNKYAKKS